jgi:CDP-glycerol glycerophosphotransferase (TagB/SpsB family)
MRSAVLRFFLPLVSRVLSRFCRIDKRIWIFGLEDPAQGVYELVDNSKYLFLVASNEFKGTIRPIWISWTRRLAMMLRRRGYESYWVMSTRGLEFALQAGCFFSHMGRGVMQEMVGCGRALKVELWHGIPLKTVHESVQANCVVATSESLRNVFASCLGVRPSQVIVSGYPRNDALLRTVNGYDIGVRRILNSVLEVKKSARIVLYAPTYRDYLSTSPDELMKYLHIDKARLDQVLRENGACLIAKFHKLLKHSNASQGLEKISERVYAINEPVDLYPILTQTDVLVTDYSSVFFDFLFLDRPIVFYVPDCERYLRERGFCLDFDAYTPGAKAKSFEQLLLALGDALMGNDQFVRQRKEVRERVFDNVDGLSSERVIRCVMKILDL